jgi:hypothetical protein
LSSQRIESYGDEGVGSVLIGVAEGGDVGITTAGIVGELLVDEQAVKKNKLISRVCGNFFKGNI